MLQPHSLAHGMRVVTREGRQLGTVDSFDENGIKLAKNSTADGHHHHVAADLIDRVEGDTVHLNERATALLNAAPAAAGAGAHHWTADRKSIWPWLLGALAAVILLALLLRGCDREEPAAPVAEPAVPAETALAPVVLPGGRTVQLEQNSVPFQVQEYLAGNEAAPRTFTFERLNFDTGKADIRDADRADLDNLAQVLAAYPNVRVRVVGYTDAQGGAQPNAQLGAQRAQAVAAALTGKGIAADRIETATGGESQPAETNATSQGRFENRRTELVVLSR